MDPSPRELLETVRSTAANFEVFGELGRVSADDVWFLARKHGEEALVALRFRMQGRDEDGDPVYSVGVARRLDGEVAAAGERCWSCHHPLRSFATFCSACGEEQREAAAPATLEDAAAMLTAVRVAASDAFDILGEMPRTGGGPVYFALARDSGELTRLRLRDVSDGYELKETEVALPLIPSTPPAAAPPPAAPAPRIEKAAPKPAAAPRSQGPALAGRAEVERGRHPMSRPGPTGGPARGQLLFLAVVVLAVVAAVQAYLLWW